MLKRAFDGALTPMMQFLIEHEGLSQEEASQLRKLVNKVKNKKDRLSANRGKDRWSKNESDN
jgi:predicted transcriptional regulator